MQYAKSLVGLGAGLGSLTLTVSGYGFSGFEDPAPGESCTYTAPSETDLIATGDTYYGRDNWDWCRTDWLNNAKNNLGLPGRYWDDGFGWDDPCVPTMPMARLLHARQALGVSHPDTAHSGNPDTSEPNMLIWGLRFVTTALRETRANCNNNGCQRATSWTGDAPQSDWFLQLNMLACELDANGDRLPPSVDAGFFYGRDVPGRASILIHEAHHLAYGSSHKNGKDSAYGAASSYSYQASWLSWYADDDEGSLAPHALACSAEEQANAILEQKFEPPTNQRFNVVLCEEIVDPVSICAVPPCEF